MTGIDWSKAPEDYPLWLEGTGESHRKYSGWYREAGEVFQGADGGQWRACREGQFFIVHRKPHQVLWDGEGLPPVGLKVEALIAGNGHDMPGNPGWCELTLKYKSVDFGVFERADGEEFPLWNRQYSKFRPIRTPEQIAAEEKQILQLDACAEIEPQLEGYNVDLDCSVAIRVTINAMIEAGYRKVQP